MSYSVNPQENEVLFPAGTRFKILVRKKEKQKTFFLLKEITPGLTVEQEQNEDKKLLKQVGPISDDSFKQLSGRSWECKDGKFREK